MSEEKTGNPMSEAAQQMERIPEELIWEGNPSWKVDFSKYIFGTLGAIILSIGSIWLGATKDALGTGLLGALVILLIIAGWLGWITIVRRATRYKISNLNIQVKEGVLTTSIHNLETWRIRDSAYYQDVWEKILGIGRIRLHTQDADTPTLELVGLPNDMDLYEKIKNAYVVARQRRNVLGLVE